MKPVSELRVVSKPIRKKDYKALVLSLIHI